MTVGPATEKEQVVDCIRQLIYSVQHERARQGRTFFIEEQLCQGAIVLKELTAPAEGFPNPALGMTYCTKNTVALADPNFFDEVHMMEGPM